MSQEKKDIRQKSKTGLHFTGQLLIIHDPLKKQQAVTLDFEGVTQFASPFFNFAIGQLLKDIKKEDLKHLLKIEHISETGKQVIERVIENAAEYHGNPNYREIVDDILKQQEKEFD